MVSATGVIAVAVFLVSRTPSRNAERVLISSSPCGGVPVSL